MSTAQSFLLADTWMHGGWGWGWMTVMMVVMVLFWCAVIFGIAWAVRNAAFDRPKQRNTSVDHPEQRTESPIDILDRRFAEGAIPVEGYQARREVLLNGPAGSNGARKKDELTAVTGGREP